MTLDCFCGEVEITVCKKPDFVHACNCSLCRKAGARWGYFDPSEVRVKGDSSSYRRRDKAEPAVDVHSCAKCGSTTHFKLTEAAVGRLGNVMLGVNMALAEESDLAGVELRYRDGKAWSGNGEFGYVREARIIGHS